VGQTIGFRRLPFAPRGRPQKPMVSSTGLRILAPVSTPACLTGKVSPVTVSSWVLIHWESIPNLVTVIPESWYSNCSSGGTAERESLRSSVPATSIQDSCARTSPDPVLIASCFQAQFFLPLLFSHLSALREVLAMRRGLAALRVPTPFRPPRPPMVLCC